MMMNNIINYCDNKKKCETAGYSKMVTGGNDPTISQRMLYSSYVGRAKSHTNYADVYASLDNQGLVFTPVSNTVLVSLKFTNARQLNIPRLKVFSLNRAVNQ
jgi:hypothetical protein